MQPTASGTNRDKQGKSFVDSPTRGSDFTAQEVYVGNQHSDPVPVDFTTRGAPTVDYNEVSSTGIETLEIINKTITAGKGVDLVSANMSGENRAVYSVEINGSVIGKTRTYYTHYDTRFVFSELNLTGGDNIKIIVENKTNEAASFNASLIFNEYDL